MLLADLRHALRRLARQPALSAVIVATLALGIGANTAIFTVVDAVLLRPLPFPDADRLVSLGERSEGWSSSLASSLSFVEWRERNRSLEAIAAAVWWDANLESGDEPRRVALTNVTDDFFRTLGVRPLLGRTFLPEEVTARSPVVVLAYHVWRELGADPRLVGREVRINGIAHTVVGVMPPLRYAGPFIGLGDVWSPWVIDLATVRARRSGWRGLQVVGRLRPGVPLAAARADFRAMHARLGAEYPDLYRQYAAAVTPLREMAAGDAARPVTVLGAAVTLVLLIACANVANLLLTQATVRQREVALRAALGASTGRLARRFLAESAVLSAAGAAVGIAGAWAALRLLATRLNADLPQLAAAALDGRALALTVVLAVVTTLACGALPAAGAARRALADTLRPGTRAGAGRRGDAARRALVAGEVALALALLVVAGLMLRTFRNLMAVGPGVRPAQVLTLDVTLPTRRYPTKESRAAFFRALMARLAAVPGVTAVGANRYFPLRDRQYSNPVFVEGRAAAAGAEPIVQYGGITDGYLDAMGIRVVDGRGFTAAETWETPGAVLVSEQMAREHWPGVRAVGRRLRIGPGLPWLTVVGVVADVRQRELDAPAAPQLYVPYSDFQHSTMTVAVRTAGDAARRLPDVVRALRALDPLLPPFNVATLDELMARSQPGRRVATDVLGGFGVLALGLALVGVASAMSYTVAQSTREIGVRMALGARRWDVVRLVLAQGGRVAGAGIVAGLAIALGAARLLRGLLFGVSAADPGTLAAVAAAVAVTVLGACVVPAWRAARADPLAALRADGA